MPNEYVYNSPEVELEVLSVSGDWNPEDFIFSVTTNTELLKKGTLFIKVGEDNTNVVSSVLNFSNNGGASYSVLNTGNSLVSSLPVSGIETSADFLVASRNDFTSIYVNDTEKVRVTLTGTTLDNLAVTGNTVLSGDLVVGGSLTVDLSSYLNFQNPFVLGSTLTVSGSSSLLGGISVDGATTTDSLVVSGDTVLSGLVVQNSLSVTGTSTLGELISSGDLDIQGNAYVSGDLIVGGMIYADLGTTIDLNSPVILGNTLEVSGSATLDSTLVVSGLTTTSGLVVQNDVDVTGNVTVTGDLTVLGNIISDSISAPFDPSLPIILGSTLNVSGSTVLESNLEVSGATTLESTLVVSGLTTTSGLTVLNTLDVQGNVTVTGNVTIEGNITASNLGGIDPNLPIEFGSTLTVTGNTNLLGNLNVSGLTTTSGLLVKNNIISSGTVLADGFTSYISTGSSINTDTFYAPLVNLSIAEQDNFTSLTLLIAQDGGSSDSDRNSALLHFRIKQQNEMQTVYVTPPDTVTLSEDGEASWSSVAEATSGYQYQFTNNAVPDENDWSVTSNLTISENISSFGGQTVYFFVKSFGGISYSSDSVYVNFAAPVTVVLDENGDASWSSVTNAPGYQYQLSTISTATGTWSSQVVTTSVTGLSLSGFTGTVAYLHVRVTDSTNSSFDSTYIPFSAPTGIILTVDGEASWFAVTDATNYQYQYSTSSTPEILDEDWTTTTNLYSSEDISSNAGDEVFVFVRVSGSANNYGSDSAVAAGVPTNLVFNTYTSGISWDMVPGSHLVGGYKYKVTTNSDADIAPEVWVTTPTESNNVMLDSFSAGQTVYLHVKVANSEVYASTSSSMPSALTSVLLDTDSRTATWNEPISGLSYQYQVNQSTSPNAMAWVAVIGIQPISLNLSQYASSAQVYFHVRASGLTATASYDDDTMPVVTIDPATGEANWDIIPGANGSYEYQVSTTSAPMVGMWTATDNPPETVSLASITEGQTFYFFVRASGGSFYNFTSALKPASVVSGLSINVGLSSATGNWTYNPDVLYQYQFASSSTPNEGSWQNTQYSGPPVMGSSMLVSQGQLLYFIVQRNNTPSSRSSISGARPYYSAPTNVTFNSTGYATWDQVIGASSYQYQIGTSSTPTGAVWTTPPFSFPPSVQTDVSSYNGQTVYFFVRVTDSINYGSASALINTGMGGGGGAPM